jgi:acyl-CoA thioesterase
VSAFETASAVTPLGPGRYQAQADPAWFVRRGGNGGYVAGVMLRALLAEVGDPGRTPRSLTVHYPAAFEGTGEIAARIERSGRSLTTASARMTVDDTPVALALAAFSPDRPTVDYADIAAPAVPRPVDLDPVVYPDLAPPFAANFHAWLADGHPPFSGADRAHAAVWLSLKEPGAIDYPLLAMLTDAWMPVLFATQAAPFMAPTVDLTVHFRSPLQPGDEGPWLCVFRTRLAAHGFMDEEGEVWSSDGVLLAQSRQLALAAPGW